jgi:hypothetical protein
MTLGKVIVLITALVSAMLLSSTAMAGEAKNQTPFTNKTTTGTAVAGDAKNELPFTRVVVHDAAPLDWFERYAAAHPYGGGVAATIVPTSSGFRWGDAAIGSATTGAAAVLLLSAILLSVRRRKISRAVGA